MIIIKPHYLVSEVASS